MTTLQSLLKYTTQALHPLKPNPRLRIEQSRALLSVSIPLRASRLQVTIHEHQKRRHQRRHPHEELTGKLCLVFPLTRPGVYAPHGDRRSSRAILDGVECGIRIGFCCSSFPTSYCGIFSPSNPFLRCVRSESRHPQFAPRVTHRRR